MEPAEIPKDTIAAIAPEDVSFVNGERVLNPQLNESSIPPGPGQAAPLIQVSPSRQPPPVAPIKLPEPGDTTPATIDLPLPPDEMPDSPPRTAQDLPEGPPKMPTSPSKARIVSILDEPLKLLSGFWPGTPVTDADAFDGFDAALVVKSMRVLADDEPLLPVTSPSQSAIIAAAAVLPDTAQLVSADKGRTSLQTRLANATSSIAKPSLAKLQTVMDVSIDDRPAESLISPTSEEGTALPVLSTSASASSLARKTVARPRALTRTSKESRRGWSSSESDDEKELRVQRQPSRRVPSGPRTQFIHKRAVSGTSVFPKTPVLADTEDDSSSDDESLAVLRSRASRSNVSLQSTVASPLVRPTLAPTSSSSASIYGLTAVDSSARTNVDPARPAGDVRRSSRPTIPTRSPAGAFAPLLQDVSRGSNHSQTSSQSGLTSDSVGHQLMTPLESTVDISHQGQPLGYSTYAPQSAASMGSQPVGVSLVVSVHLLTKQSVGSLPSDTRNSPYNVHHRQPSYGQASSWSGQGGFDQSIDPRQNQQTDPVR